MAACGRRTGLGASSARLVIIVRRQPFASQPARSKQSYARTSAREDRSPQASILGGYKEIGDHLALLLGECRVRAMRGSLVCAPLLGYWILAVVVSLDLGAQWTLVVFGPPLVLMAWLDALCRSHAVVRGQPGVEAGLRREGLGGRRRWQSPPKEGKHLVTTAAKGAAPGLLVTHPDSGERDSARHLPLDEKVGRRQLVARARIRASFR